MLIKLFGIAGDIVQARSLELSAEGLNTVGDLKNFLSAKYPELKKLSSLAVAVDHEYADDAQMINAGSEIALIPPVSGG